jgi:tetratricopeptide (TPR) repeat protein
LPGPRPGGRHGRRDRDRRTGPRRQPQAADLHYLSGNLGLHRGQLDAAIAAYGRALAIDPAHPEANYNCGIALLGASRPAEALQRFDARLQARPDYPAALNHRGAVLLQLQRPAEALESYERALQLAPDLTAAWIDKGRILRDGKRFEEALAAFERARANAPDHLDLLNDLGLVLRDLKRPIEALAAFERALQLKPDFAEALGNRGLVLQELDRFDEALAAYEPVACSCARTSPTAMPTAATRCRSSARHEEALAAYERALAIKPGYEAIYLNEEPVAPGPRRPGGRLAEVRMALAEQLELPPQRHSPSHCGWAGAARRQDDPDLRRAGPRATRSSSAATPRPLAERGAYRVCCGCSRRSCRCCRGLEGVARVFGATSRPPRFDFHCPLLSLPLAFGTTLETIPSGRAVRAAGGQRFAERLAAWEARLGPADKPADRPGVVGQRPSQERPQPLDPAADLRQPSCSPRGRFIALQNEIRDADAAVLKQRGDIEWFGDALVDFAETAALVAQLDLVVSVDTSVAISPPRWASPCGCCCRSIPTGAGCSAATTVPGTRRCGSSGRRGGPSGTMSSTGSDRRSRGASPESTAPGSAGRSLRLDAIRGGLFPM